MGSGPTISIRYARRILAAAASRGIGAAELGPAAALPRDEETRIGADPYFRLWAAAMKQVGDPAFPS